MGRLRHPRLSAPGRAALGATAVVRAAPKRAFSGDFTRSGAFPGAPWAGRGRRFSPALKLLPGLGPGARLGLNAVVMHVVLGELKSSETNEGTAKHVIFV